MSTFFDFDLGNEPTNIVENSTTNNNTTALDADGNPIQSLDTKQKTSESFVFGNLDTTIDTKNNSSNNDPIVPNIKDLFTGIKEHLPDGILDSDNITTDTIKGAFDAYGDKAVDSFLQQAITENEMLGNILSYVKNGGDITTLSNTVANTVIISKMPFETDDDKRAVLHAAYIKEGKSNDEASLFIKSIEDNGKLDAVSNTVRNRIIDAENLAIKTLADNQRIDEANRKAQNIKNNALISETINNATPEVLSGISIKDKRALVDYMTTPKYKDTATNTEYTQFTVDLNKILADPIKKTLVAELVRTNFDFSSLSLKAKEELIKNINKDTPALVNAVHKTDAKQTSDAFYDFIK